MEDKEFIAKAMNPVFADLQSKVEKQERNETTKAINDHAVLFKEALCGPLSPQESLVLRGAADQKKVLTVASLMMASSSISSGKSVSALLKVASKKTADIEIEAKV